MTVPQPARHAKGRILVIDDEPDIRESLEALLTGEGFSVELAQNGTEGLQKLESRGNSQASAPPSAMAAWIAAASSPVTRSSASSVPGPSPTRPPPLPIARQRP